MNCSRRLTDTLYWVGANDRRIALFENVYPVPRGVSYNSYLLLDEKTALFDTIDQAFTHQLLENVSFVLDGRSLDYLIVNHMEPDHCASIADILFRYPGVKIVCTDVYKRQIWRFPPGPGTHGPGPSISVPLQQPPPGLSLPLSPFL